MDQAVVVYSSVTVTSTVPLLVPSLTVARYIAFFDEFLLTVALKVADDVPLTVIVSPDTSDHDTLAALPPLQVMTSGLDVTVFVLGAGSTRESV